MGCRILAGNEGACFFDSVTMVPFGVILEDEEEAIRFQRWVKVDLRLLTHEEFMGKLDMFRDQINMGGENEL